MPRKPSPEHTRMVELLNQGKDSTEIAQILGIDKGVMAQRVYRYKQKLKAQGGSLGDPAQNGETPTPQGILEQDKSLEANNVTTEPQGHGSSIQGAIAGAAKGDELAARRAKKAAQGDGQTTANDVPDGLPPTAAAVVWQHLLEAPNLGDLKQYVWTDVAAATKVETRATLYNTYLRTLLAERQILADQNPGAIGAGMILGDDDEIQIITDEDRDERIVELVRLAQQRRAGAG